ncbi:MAG TPA: AarF/ABC1/UbiB kinase family protein, partial [Phycisphaerae bacterium]|nr:AarF/ABC1/UbiB kinase family protein [Phycisphaerae bacterium]
TLELVNKRMRERFRPSAIIQTVLESTELLAQLPRRLNDLLTQIGKTGIRFDVDAFDEQTFIVGFEKVANRITAGLILAALIIGAALLMRVETTFTLFGYPGLAIILFLAAFIGGIILLVDILLYDRKKPDK